MLIPPTVAFEIQVFVPFNSQWSPLSTASDLIAITSEPACGSVIANAPRISAFTSFWMYFFFCSSVPYRRIVYAHPISCMFTCTRSELDARAISSVMIAAASHPMLFPPYSSGITVPNSPSSPIGFTTSAYGK